MKNTRVTLVPLEASDREQFILDNQWAFKHGAMVEFGERDNHIDGDEEIISRRTIEGCIDSPNSEVYRIAVEGRNVGGVILKIDERCHRNELEILFVLPEEHSKGIGYGAWCAVEALYPETEVWETCTPYFDKRNIHFYVNKCGFKIDEFWCKYFTPSHEGCEIGAKESGNVRNADKCCEECESGRALEDGKARECGEDHEAGKARENGGVCDEDRGGAGECCPDEGPDEMFHFIKVMK